MSDENDSVKVEAQTSDNNNDPQEQSPALDKQESGLQLLEVESPTALSQKRRDSNASPAPHEAIKGKIPVKKLLSCLSVSQTEQTNQNPKPNREKRFVEMIMRQQAKLARRLREKQLALEAQSADVPVDDTPKVQPVDLETGCIEHKVDFTANISENASNSWDEGDSLEDYGEEFMNNYNESDYDEEMTNVQAGQQQQLDGDELVGSDLDDDDNMYDIDGNIIVQAPPEQEPAIEIPASENEPNLASRPLSRVIVEDVDYQVIQQLPNEVHGQITSESVSDADTERKLTAHDEHPAQPQLEIPDTRQSQKAHSSQQSLRHDTLSPSITIQQIQSEATQPLQLPERTETSQTDQPQKIQKPDESIEPKPEPAKKKKTKRFVVNVKQTRYEVIKKVARKVLNWKMKYYEEDAEGGVESGHRNCKLNPAFDITWHDTAITQDFFQKLHPYQKVNMYPGIHCITKKHTLAKNLMRMCKVFPQEFNFFPKTWVLPSQLTDLRNHFAHNANSRNKATYIVKPDSLCQGKGIFLSRNVDEIMQKIQSNDLLDEHNINSSQVTYVAQQYLDKPHLIDELKYDLRVYVFLYGVNPLRIYLHQLAFARFCTEPYEKPHRDNLDNVFMHLTNYALNKDSELYEQGGGEDEDEGHKRSLGAILRMLKAEGCDTEVFMDQVKDMIVKTMITGQPILSHEYKIGQPDCLDNSMAFQILGFDILIDSKFKPYLLEVNCSPSFRTDSQLDYVIKKNVIADAFQMLNFNQERKEEMIEIQREKKEERMKTGRTIKMSQQQREQLRQERLKERFTHESENMRGYELIYPCADKDKNKEYDKFIAKSQDLWDEFFIGKKNLKAKQNGELNKKGVTQKYSTMQVPQQVNKPAQQATMPQPQSSNQKPQPTLRQVSKKPSANQVRNILDSKDTISKEPSSEQKERPGSKQLLRPQPNNIKLIHSLNVNEIAKPDDSTTSQRQESPLKTQQSEKKQVTIEVIPPTSQFFNPTVSVQVVPKEQIFDSRNTPVGTPMSLQQASPSIGQSKSLPQNSTSIQTQQKLHQYQLQSIVEEDPVTATLRSNNNSPPIQFEKFAPQLQQESLTTRNLPMMKDRASLGAVGPIQFNMPPPQQQSQPNQPQSQLVTKHKSSHFQDISSQSMIKGMTTYALPQQETSEHFSPEQSRYTHSQLLTQTNPQGPPPRMESAPKWHSQGSNKVQLAPMPQPSFVSSPEKAQNKKSQQQPMQVLEKLSLDNANLVSARTNQTLQIVPSMQSVILQSPQISQLSSIQTAQRKNASTKSYQNHQPASSHKLPELIIKSPKPEESRLGFLQNQHDVVPIRPVQNGKFGKEPVPMINFNQHTIQTQFSHFASTSQSSQSPSANTERPKKPVITLAVPQSKPIIMPQKEIIKPAQPSMLQTGGNHQAHQMTAAAIQSKQASGFPQVKIQPPLVKVQAPKKKQNKYQNNQQLVNEFSKLLVPKPPQMQYKGPVSLATALGLQKLNDQPKSQSQAPHLAEAPEPAEPPLISSVSNQPSNFLERQERAHSPQKNEYKLNAFQVVNSNFERLVNEHQLEVAQPITHRVNHNGMPMQSVYSRNQYQQPRQKTLPDEMPMLQERHSLPMGIVSGSSLVKQDSNLNVGYDKKALVGFFQSYVSQGQQDSQPSPKMPTNPHGSRANSPIKNKQDSCLKHQQRLIRSQVGSPLPHVSQDN